MSCHPLPTATAKLLLLLALLPNGIHSWAQRAAAVVNMSTTARLTESDDLAIKASRENIAVVREKIKQAKAFRYGQIRTDAQYMRYNSWIRTTTASLTALLPGNTFLTVPPALLAPQDAIHIRLEDEAPLFTGWKILSSVGASREGERIAESSYDDTRLNSVLEAEQFCLGALLTRDILHLNKEGFNVSI